MHKQHPQTAYRKYAVLMGTIFENCDNFLSCEKTGGCAKCCAAACFFI